MPAPFIIDLPQGRSSGLMWGQIRPDASPRSTVLIRPRGEAGFRPDDGDEGADGIWTLRMTITPGAQYRYRWTPVPSSWTRLRCRASRGSSISAAASPAPFKARSRSEERATPAAFYAAGYSLADREQSLKLGRWRELGARTKAAHAVALCRPGRRT